MKAIIPIILASAVNAQEIPMTPELAQSLQLYINTTRAVCEKLNIPSNECGEKAQKEIDFIQNEVKTICADYPKEIIECSQYWLKHLMDMVSRNNILILKSKSV